MTSCDNCAKYKKKALQGQKLVTLFKLKVKEIDSLKLEKESLEASIKKLNYSNSELQSTLILKDGVVKKKTETILNLEGKIRAVVVQNNDYITTLTRLEKELEELKSSNNNNTVDSNNTAKEIYEKLLSTKDNELGRLKEEKKNSDKQLSQLQLDIQKLNIEVARVKNLNATINNISPRTEDLTEKIKTKEKENEQLYSEQLRLFQQIETLKKEKEKNDNLIIKRERNSSQKELLKKNAQVLELQNNIKGLQESESASNTIIVMLKKELAQVIASHKGKDFDSKKRIIFLEESLAKQEQETKNHKKLANDKNLENLKLNKECAKLENLLSEKDKEIQLTNKAIEEIKMSRDALTITHTQNRQLLDSRFSPLISPIKRRYTHSSTQTPDNFGPLSKRIKQKTDNYFEDQEDDSNSKTNKINCPRASSPKNDEIVQYAVDLARNRGRPNRMVHEEQSEYVWWCCEQIRTRKRNAQEVMRLLQQKCNVDNSKSIIIGITKAWQTCCSNFSGFDAGWGDGNDSDDGSDDDNDNSNDGLIEKSEKRVRMPFVESAILFIIFSLRFFYDKEDMVDSFLTNLACTIGMNLNVKNLKLLEIFCRAYCGLCRLMKDVDRVKTLLYDIVAMCDLNGIIPLCRAIAGVWPCVFYTPAILNDKMEDSLAFAVRYSISDIVHSLKTRKIDDDNFDPEELELIYKKMCNICLWKSNLTQNVLKLKFLPHCLGLITKFYFVDVNDQLKLGDPCQNAILAMSLVLFTWIKESSWTHTFQNVFIAMILPKLKQNNSIPSVVGFLEIAILFAKVGLSYQKEDSVELQYLREIAHVYLTSVKAPHEVKIMAAELLAIVHPKDKQPSLFKWIKSLSLKQRRNLSISLQQIQQQQQQT